MTEESAHKYTDTHVRANRQLYEELAVTYLTHYVGEFDLLLSYRRRVRLGDGLTVPMIRATLNCMRFDAQVVNMPEPPVHEFDADPDGVVVDFAKKRERVKKAPYVPPKPRYVKLRTRWNKTYVMSSWSTASRVHRVHPDSHFEWDTTEKTFVCRLWWVCKPSWDHPRFPFELLTEADAAIAVASWPGWELCKKCQKEEVK